MLSGLLRGNTHSRRIGLGHLANVFCRGCGDEEEDEDEAALHLLCLSPALGWKRNGHLGAYYMEDLNELSCINNGSLSHFIGSSVWLLKLG